MKLQSLLHLLCLSFATAGLSFTSRAADASAPPALPPDVQRFAVQRGKAIAAETFALLRTNLHTAIQAGGISNALPFCSAAAAPLSLAQARKHGVTLKRVSHKARNPAGQANADEMAVIAEFEKALSLSTNPPPAFATNLVAGHATFFAPITINHELCLKCHGEPGKDIAPGTLALIRKLYPRDEAVGFKPGQLRGAWRIDFPIASLKATDQAVPAR